ncbi:Uncharacterised protein [Candidatus Tiddalikarchaeum anstoanum]|nr:Uncharacterised protein [Candidatus Tiddalikarchaeum anstoanum]
MLENYEKIQGIIKLQKLKLPTPSTVFVADYEIQEQEINEFLLGREYVMIRSEKIGQSTHCPRNLKCPVFEAKKFITELNKDNYVAIVQDYIPLNNLYSGNILLLNNSFIIEAMQGGPVSKLNREGKVDIHLRINKEGKVIFKQGIELIPSSDISRIIGLVKDLPLKFHILEFSAGPDWFYFWHAKEDATSAKLEL